MINPIDYLFYKIYNGLDLIGGGTEVVATTLLVQINLMTIAIAIFGTVSLEAFIFIGIIGLYLVSYYTDNQEKIMFINSNIKNFDPKVWEKYSEKIMEDFFSDFIQQKKLIDTDSYSNL